MVIYTMHTTKTFCLWNYWHFVEPNSFASIYFYSHFNSYHCCIVYIHVFLRSFLHSVFFLLLLLLPPPPLSTSFFAAAVFGCKHACIFPFVIELVYIVRLPMLVLCVFFLLWFAAPEQQRKQRNITTTTEIWLFETVRVFCRPLSLLLSLSPIISIIAIGLSTTFNYKCISGKTECNC